MWEKIFCDLLYGCVSTRWDLIAGRIPGRTAEQVERFWIMRHSEGFAFARRGKEDKKKAKYGGVLIR